MMTTKRGITKLRGTATLTLLLLGGLISTACSNGSPGPASTPVAAGNTPVANSTTPPAQAMATAQASTPGSSNKGKFDCQAIANAAFDLNSSEPILVMLTGGGSVQNKVDSPFYVDTTKLRADLDVLSALPDPTDAQEISLMGKPSEAILQFRELFDIIDKNAKADPTPDGSVSDQQLADFGAKFIKMSTAINAAVGDACPNASPDVSQPEPVATAAP